MKIETPETRWNKFSNLKVSALSKAQTALNIQSKFTLNYSLQATEQKQTLWGLIQLFHNCNTDPSF